MRCCHLPVLPLLPLLPLWTQGAPTRPRHGADRPRKLRSGVAAWSRCWLRRAPLAAELRRVSRQPQRDRRDRRCRRRLRRLARRSPQLSVPSAACSLRLVRMLRRPCRRCHHHRRHRRRATSPPTWHWPSGCNASSGRAGRAAPPRRLRQSPTRRAATKGLHSSPLRPECTAAPAHRRRMSGVAGSGTSSRAVR